MPEPEPDASRPAAQSLAAQSLTSDDAVTRERLARLRLDFLGVVDASRDSNADDEHDPEGHTIAYERSQVDALIRQAERHLVEIEAALERLSAGTYGVCTGCGQPVPDGRLEARPTARTCVSCV